MTTKSKLWRLDANPELDPGHVWSKNTKTKTTVSHRPTFTPQSLMLKCLTVCVCVCLCARVLRRQSSAMYSFSNNPSSNILQTCTYLPCSVTAHCCTVTITQSHTHTEKHTHTHIHKLLLQTLLMQTHTANKWIEKEEMPLAGCLHLCAHW